MQNSLRQNIPIIRRKPASTSVPATAAVQAIQQEIVQYNSEIGKIINAEGSGNKYLLLATKDLSRNIGIEAELNDEKNKTLRSDFNFFAEALLNYKPKDGHEAEQIVLGDSSLSHKKYPKKTLEAQEDNMITDIIINDQQVDHANTDFTEEFLSVAKPKIIKYLREQGQLKDGLSDDQLHDAITIHISTSALDKRAIEATHVTLDHIGVDGFFYLNRNMFKNSKPKVIKFDITIDTNKTNETSDIKNRDRVILNLKNHDIFMILLYNQSPQSRSLYVKNLLKNQTFKKFFEKHIQQIAEQSADTIISEISRTPKADDIQTRPNRLANFEPKPGHNL